LKVANIVGARPNFIKIAPIIAEMRKRSNLEPVLIHTGQHYDPNMSGTFFSDLEIPVPDYNLNVGSGSHAIQTAKVMLALEPLLIDLKPDLLLVVGDVNSTLAATLVAVKMGLRVAHVEAGLRSYDRSMPEEINRVLTDAVADYLFVTERSAIENLRREGIPPGKIFFVGNVMIDTLLRQRERAIALRVPQRFGMSPGGYALLTLHRPANVDNPEILAGLLDAVDYLQQRIPVLFPAHPRTLHRLEEFALIQRVQAMTNVIQLDPLGYIEFLGLMAQARLVLTDSGGIQEETTALDISCVTLRENTERPVTVLEGTNQIAGRDPQNIIAAINRVLSGQSKQGSRPELWDGKTAERIVDILCKYSGD
jgi:UDP-N-acetylglucosamine 2-epimerase (non-hydrolysing)